MKKRIRLLYTGGTIGMQRSARGYLPAPLDRLLQEMPALSARADMPDHELIEYPDPIDSANAGPADWRRIAADIVRDYERFDGFVVMHGTDTMAHTASALSFMLQGLQKPVLVTGSQIPLQEIRNDAQNNLITALLLADRYPVAEVCLYFNGRLLRGNRARKLKADSFDAFDSPNYPWLGEVGIKIDIHRDRLLGDAGPECFQVPEVDGFREVALLKLFPGLTADWLDRLLAPPLAGLVLESYGVGNAPDRIPGLLAAIERATTRGLVVLNVSQCLEGWVDPAGYATGSALAGVGACCGFDLTPEAALAKLHHLLALGLSPEAVRTELSRSLCGECTVAAPG